MVTDRLPYGRKELRIRYDKLLKNATYTWFRERIRITLERMKFLLTRFEHMAAQKLLIPLP